MRVETEIKRKEERGPKRPSNMNNYKTNTGIIQD